MDSQSLTFATSILTRAVRLDTEDRFTESLVCYQEGINILLESLKTFSNEDPKKRKLRTKVDEYMSRAEKVKQHIDELKSKGSYREQIQVPEDGTGFSYRAVLHRFLNDDVTSVEIDDPYIRSAHQCDNFVRFLELCIQSCSKLRIVKLTTGRDNNSPADQVKRLESIRGSLKNATGKFNKNLIQLHIEYSDSLHDREIRLDNGWVVKIGRGLDYFKQLDRFHVGFSDFDFRHCRSTTIDVFHRKELQKIK